MKLISFLKSNTAFFIIVFLAFICVMFALNAGYPYYPNPPPNEFQPQPAAPTQR